MNLGRGAVFKCVCKDDIYCGFKKKYPTSGMVERKLKDERQKVISPFVFTM